MPISDEQYGMLQKMYSLLNEKFFSGELPDVVFVLDDSKRHAAGYFRYHAYTRSDSGDPVSCLALNPVWFRKGPDDVVDTLLHEMCHCGDDEQDHAAHKAGYHTNAWIQKMREVGLEPDIMNSSRTKVGDHPIAGGPFQTFMADCEFRDQVIRILAPDTGSAGIAPEGTKKPKSKVKYSCSCGTSVWGKRGLHLHCPLCDEDFEQEEE